MIKFSTLITAALLITASSVTYAAGNGYCNGLPAQHDKVSCYNQAIDTLNNQMARDLTTIDSLPKLPLQWRMNFHRKMQAWVPQVNVACRGQVVCTYDSLHNQLIVMGGIIYKNR